MVGSGDLECCLNTSFLSVHLTLIGKRVLILLSICVVWIHDQKSKSQKCTGVNLPSSSKQVGSCLNENLCGQIFIFVKCVSGTCCICVKGAVLSCWTWTPAGYQGHLFISTNPLSSNNIAGSWGNWFSRAIQIVEFLITLRSRKSNCFYVLKFFVYSLACSLNRYWWPVQPVPGSRLNADMPGGKKTEGIALVLRGRLIPNEQPLCICSLIQDVLVNRHWGRGFGKNIVRSRDRLSPHASLSQGVVIKYAPCYLLTRCTVVKWSIFHGRETCGARQSHTRRTGPAWEVQGGHHPGSDEQTVTWPNELARLDWPVRSSHKEPCDFKTILTIGWS